MREAVGGSDIVLRHLDVGNVSAAMVGGGFDGALVLVKERNGVDEREVLVVIAAGCGCVARGR